MKEGAAGLLALSRVEAQAGTTEANFTDLESQRTATKDNLAVLAGLTPAEVDPILTPVPLPSISPRCW
jgi:outer membrane protein TolC